MGRLETVNAGNDHDLKIAIVGWSAASYSAIAELTRFRVDFDFYTNTTRESRIKNVESLFSENGEPFRSDFVNFFNRYHDRKSILDYIDSREISAHEIKLDSQDDSISIICDGNVMNVDYSHCCIMGFDFSPPRLINSSIISSSNNLFYRISEIDIRGISSVIVIGAGNQAADAIIELTKKDIFCYQIVRKRERARISPDRMQKLADLELSGMLFTYWNAAPVDIGTNSVSINCPSGKETINGDAILCQLGVLPGKFFLENCGFDIEEGTDWPVLNSMYKDAERNLFCVGGGGEFSLISTSFLSGSDVARHISCGEKFHSVLDEFLDKMNLFDTGINDSYRNRISRKIPIINEMSDDTFRKFMLHANIEKYKTNHVVAEYRLKGDVIGFVLSGSVEVKYFDGYAVNIEEGELFGEQIARTNFFIFELIKTGPRGAVVIFVPRTIFLTCLASSPSMRDIFIKTANERASHHLMYNKFLISEM